MSLPELPEPDLGYIQTDKSNQPAFSATQMREQINARREAQEQLYAERERHTAEVKKLQAEIGRLQALRPVPMTDEQRQQAFNKSWATSSDFFAGIEAAEAHHGITAQGAQEGE